MPDDTRRPLLVTFSGLDGSGKSTQITNLLAHVKARGMRAVSLAFWDDVVVAKGYREKFVHKVYGSERGVGTSHSSPFSEITDDDIDALFGE